MEQQEVIDLSHLTEEERAKLMAVIDADEELRVLNLSLTGSNRYSSSDNDRKNTELQQLHLKLESDHRYGSELLRRSLIAASEQTSGGVSGGNNLSDLDSQNNVDLPFRPVKVSLDDLPEVKQYDVKDKRGTLQKRHSIIIKSSSTESLGSLTSMYSAPVGKGDYDITGKLEVAVWYKDGQLLVQVVRAKGLAAVKKRGISSPYVKMYLLPDRGKCTKRKTGVQHKTTDPVFDEILKIKTEQSHLSSRTLWLSVWDWDMFGRNHFLGEVYLPLSSLDLTKSKNHWYSLQDKDESTFHNDSYQGKLRVGLMYLPRAKLVASSKKTTRIIGTLHIAVYQAENLPVMDENELTNATVKIYLLPNQSSPGKYKTQVINHNLNPVWNEQFTYEKVYMDDLSSWRVLEITVWDYDRRGSNDLIGGVRIGPHPDSVSHTLEDWMDSTGDEVTHWKAMLEQPGEWVEQWHTLRPFMEPASKYHYPPSSVDAMKSSGAKKESTAPDIVKCSTFSISSTIPPRHDQLSPPPAPSVPFPCDRLNHSSQQADVVEPPDQLLLEAIDGETRAVGRDGDSESNVNTSTQAYKEKDTFIPESMPLHGDHIDSNNTSSLYKKTAYDITGEVLVGVYYKNGQLHIHVERARGLAAADSNGYSDPYIKTYLLPDEEKQTKQKTSVKKKTLDPVYNETLRYEISKPDLVSRTLWLSVWDWDRFHKNHSLGEVCLSLSSLDLSDTANHWYQLQDKEATDGDEDAVYRGELRVGLKYRPDCEWKPTGTLIIDVKQAKQLPPMDGYTTDSVVKLYLLPDRKSSGRRKTGVIKNSVNPVWEEKFTFEDVNLNELSRERVLEISVWNYDNSSHAFIGGLRLGPAPGSAAKHKDWMDSIGDEVTHWEDMLANPGEWMEQWHTLRTSLNPRDDSDLYTYFYIDHES